MHTFEHAICVLYTLFLLTFPSNSANYTKQKASQAICNCPPGEHFAICFAQEPTCDDQKPQCQIFCSANGKCVCDNGLVREKDGGCIESSQCPKTTTITPTTLSICAGNETLAKEVCAKCELNCGKTELLCPYPPAGQKCHENHCQCSGGFFRTTADQGGGCVRFEDCPIETTTKNST